MFNQGTISSLHSDWFPGLMTTVKGLMTTVKGLLTLVKVLVTMRKTIRDSFGSM